MMLKNYKSITVIEIIYACSGDTSGKRTVTEDQDTETKNG